jgi:hypothetical protein
MGIGVSRPVGGNIRQRVNRFTRLLVAQSQGVTGPARLVKARAGLPRGNAGPRLMLACGSPIDATFKPLSKVVR